MPGFDPDGLGANPSEAAKSVQPVSSKSEQQSYKLRTLESYQHGLPILPLSVEVCTPVSETGRAGALPAAAANFLSAGRNQSECMFGDHSIARPNYAAR